MPPRKPAVQTRMGRMILGDTRAPERRSRNRTDFYYPFNRTSVRLLDVARGIRGPNPDLSVDDLAYCRLIPVDVNFVADQIISVDRKTQVPTPVPGQGARFDGCGRVGGDDLHKVVWGGAVWWQRVRWLAAKPEKAPRSCSWSGCGAGSRGSFAAAVRFRSGPGSQRRV